VLAHAITLTGVCRVYRWQTSYLQLGYAVGLINI